MHMMSKTQFGIQKVLVRLSRRIGQLQPQRSMSEICTCLLPPFSWDIHLFCSRYGFFVNNKGIFVNEMTATNNGATINCKSANSVAVVLSRVCWDKSPTRCFRRYAASGDRKPTASGYREQTVPHWFKPYTEGRLEGEFGWSDSVGELIPKVLLPRVSARFSHTSPGKTIYLHIFRRTPIGTFATWRRDNFQRVSLWELSERCRDEAREAPTKHVDGSHGVWNVGKQWKACATKARVSRIDFDIVVAQILSQTSMFPRKGLETFFPMIRASIAWSAWRDVWRKNTNSVRRFQDSQISFFTFDPVSW